MEEGASGREDPAVRLLRQELREAPSLDQPVEVGQVVLLEGVLGEGSPLYDLTVEEDHSFTCAGLIVHNCSGRCRCHLEYRRVRASKSRRDRTSRPANVRNIYSLPPAPPGRRIPEGIERYAIEEKRQEMNHYRRKMADAAAAGDADSLRYYASKRRVANDELIQALDAEKLWAPPLLSVEEVTTGRMLDDHLVEGLFGLGVDGATIAALPDAAYRDIVQRVLRDTARSERQIATWWASLGKE